MADLSTLSDYNDVKLGLGSTNNTPAKTIDSFSYFRAIVYDCEDNIIERFSRDTEVGYTKMNKTDDSNYFLFINKSNLSKAIDGVMRLAIDAGDSNVLLSDGIEDKGSILYDIFILEKRP